MTRRILFWLTVAGAVGLALLPWLALGQSSTLTDGKVTLEWTYPAAELTNVTFIIHRSATVTNGFTNWTRIATVTGTNRAALVVAPGVNFFACTASNFWGESDPSNVVATPALPRDDVNLVIKRGH